MAPGEQTAVAGLCHQQRRVVVGALPPDALFHLRGFSEDGLRRLRWTLGLLPSPAPAERSEEAGRVGPSGSEPDTVCISVPRRAANGDGAGPSCAAPFTKGAGAGGLSVREWPQGSHHGATDEARAPAS